MATSSFVGEEEVVFLGVDVDFVGWVDGFLADCCLVP